MASTGTVQYKDPVTGAYKTGYYKDGTTYTDANYTNTVPVGSIVDTQGGMYIKTNDGSRLYSDCYKENNADSSGSSNDYSDYINGLYSAKQAAALSALEAAYKNNVAALDASETKIAPAYQAARNQTAATSEQSKRNFAEYAAANGLNSGTSGQAELARNVALQGNLNSLNQSESNAYSALDLQRAQLTNEYNSAIASAQADGNYELANALYQEKVRAEEAATAAKQYQDSLALQMANYNDQKTQNALNRQDVDYNRKLAMAQYLAQYGDFSGFEALGINTTQMQKAYQQELLASMGKSGGGSGSSGGGYNAGYTDVNLYDLNHNYKPTVDNGVSDADLLSAGMMTQMEWIRHKNAGSTGTEMQYDTYSDYVNGFKSALASMPGG